MTADWTSQVETLLKAIWTPELDPLFLRSDLAGAESAWHGHVPFAHWIVRALAPRCIVELGSHNGVSYAAFCRAAQREGLGTRCFAIDTWAGDEHAGFYGEDVFAGLRAYHDERFGAFSTLVRRSFDDALEILPEGSIDLLHIDGRHGYEDVRHDFESWRGKMSDRAVVLFHDTNVLGDGFGVWRLWAELRHEFPHFEFPHAHGLGVLAVGTECPPLVAALTGLRDLRAIGAVRDRFAQLGERCVLEAQVKLLGKLGGERAQLHDAALVRLQAAEAQLAQAQAGLAAAQQAAARAEWERREAQAGEQAQSGMAEAARAAAQAARAEVAAARQAQDQEAGRRADADAALEQILSSSTWRATRPLRTGLSRLPPGLRRAAHRMLRPAGRPPAPRHTEPAPPAPANGPAAAAQQPAGDAPAAHRAPAAPFVCYVSGEPDTPGSTYRVRRYAAACEAAGARVAALRLDEVSAHMAEAARAQVVVIWRAVWTDALAAFVVAARAGGARIVFDLDDLMIDPALATPEIIDGIRSQNVSQAAVQAHYAGVQRTMLAADCCSATTAELAGHMRRFGKAAVALPNGFDMETLQVSRLAARRRRAAPPDGLLRLGYAGGSRTHQRDFAQLAAALPGVLRAHPECRLVLFQAGDTRLVDLDEFPDLGPFAGQVEWRRLVPLHLLPEELARFDVNLAPLEPDNPFCEAKSELKYFEGALAGVCTVASPVGPYARAIRHGTNGFLAATPAQWGATLARLLGDPALRRQVAQAALNDVLWTYGPDRRAQLMRRVLAAWQGGAAAADAFVLEAGRPRGEPRPGPTVPAGEVVFCVDHLQAAEVTVAVPLYNYAHTLVETLDSVRAQTLRQLDLVIVDDGSTDRSLDTALDWSRANAARFNRLVVVRNHANAGLGLTRNAAFSAAETPYVLPLDADNRLRPDCCTRLLAAIRQVGAAFAYPVIQEFGGRSGLIGTAPYDPARLVGGNYVDAMALVAKGAWSAAGGYAQMRLGWEDYDFWCALAEAGLHGFAAGGAPLADYRVHDASMCAQVTDTQDVKDRVISTLERRHPWVAVARPLPPKAPAGAGTGADAGTGARAGSGVLPAAPGLGRLLPILRCPETGRPLHLADGALRTDDGGRTWPLKAGRPVLFPGLAPADVATFNHLSNELPESALDLIRGAGGLVLNLSAGGTAERFDNVIEAEAALFGNTDLIADSHALPFADETFEAVIAMNAFEHYRDPPRAAAEIRRVLRPGGRVLIRTAFLQPQHEAPHHFYNATRFGVAGWFAAFETERLHVSDNFNPSYALAWMAHECQQALRRDAGEEAARLFAEEPVGRFARFWADPASRAHRAWQDFARLSQPSQEAIAAGFEYLGRRPS